MNKHPALVHAEWLARSSTIGAPEAAAQLLRIPALEAERDALRTELVKLKAQAAQPAPADPVATLHDDGYFTWKRDEFRLKFHQPLAGWRMDVYAAPQAAQPVATVLPEVLRRSQHDKDPEHWCHEALLYSPGSPHDSPNNRINLYAEPQAAQPATDALRQIEELQRTDWLQPRVRARLRLLDETLRASPQAAQPLTDEQKDAARYRWLKAQHEVNDDEASDNNYGKTYPRRTATVFIDDGEDGLEPLQCDPGALDDYIDAAIAHGIGKEGGAA